MDDIVRVLWFAVIVGFGILIWFLSERKKEKNQEKRRPVPWNMILRDCIGKKCEIILKDPLPRTTTKKVKRKDL